MCMYRLRCHPVGFSQSSTKKLTHTNWREVWCWLICIYRRCKFHRVGFSQSKNKRTHTKLNQGGVWFMCIYKLRCHPVGFSQSPTKKMTHTNWREVWCWFICMYVQEMQVPPRSIVSVKLKKTIGHIQTEANRHAFSCGHRKDASGIHNLLITCTSSNLLITCSLTNHPKNIDQGWYYQPPAGSKNEWFLLIRGITHGTKAHANPYARSVDYKS